MVRDAFLSCELVRIDCQGLEKSDYKKIGCKLRVTVISLILCITIFKFLNHRKKGFNSNNVVLDINLGAEGGIVGRGL